MSTVEQMEHKLEVMRQNLTAARKKKEEEAWRAKEAAERKMKEEAEAQAREEKAKAVEWMAEAARKQHDAVVATAERKRRLEELATQQRRVAEKRAEKPIASGSRPFPSAMRRYKRQVAAGHTEVSDSGPFVFLTYFFV
jgi:membrane protein involved in colicin uptake